MNTSVQTIPITSLALAFLPVLVVLALLYRWTLDSPVALYAVARMLVQLLLVGYVLTYIFAAEHATIVIVVLAVMLFTASWIALRPLPGKRRHRYVQAVGAIGLGGGLTLLLVTQGVLGLQPWFWPRYLVPLAGMIFANAMNTVSLAAERFEAEMANQVPYEQARHTALRVALIPLLNSLFAVGLVSLPGMMTGQILSGVSPLIAARYQIVVMCMVFGSAGLSAVLYLMFLKPRSLESRSQGDSTT
jgi:putative ABC transport system permease protein